MADGGGVHGLTRAIPTKLAMEMILTGSSISSDRANDMVILNKTVTIVI
jgi:enoyl-CoA hydratase/carnithine racemase